MFSAAFAQPSRVSGSVVVPSSSIERPQDIGYRSHTNILLYELREPLMPPRPLSGTGTGQRSESSRSGGDARPSTSGPSTRVRSVMESGVAPAGGPGSASFFETPASLACVYGLTTPVAGCSPAVATVLPMGGSRAIAIVDAYDDPNAAVDLAVFDAQFGIASANFQVVYASGTRPPVDPTGGWEIEEALDIEWAHVMAPNAALFLVEAASNKNPDLLTAVSVAATLVAQAGGGEVSMSWGSSEFKKEVGDESYSRRRLSSISPRRATDLDHCGRAFRQTLFRRAGPRSAAILRPAPFSTKLPGPTPAAAPAPSLPSPAIRLRWPASLARTAARRISPSTPTRIPVYGSMTAIRQEGNLAGG